MKEGPDGRYSLGEERDELGATELFMKATTHENFPAAYFALGLLFCDGAGLEEEMKNAVDWLFTHPVDSAACRLIILGGFEEESDSDTDGEDRRAPRLGTG